ncbi:MAG: hypothetical protein U9Q07_13145 [Planctomycetota bacterium]|nr:hypothetical protein [Planctomycetota bacterium]
MMKFYCNSALGILILTVLVASTPIEASRPAAVSPAITRSQVEADWLRQEQVRVASAISRNAKVTPEQDAIGAFDGVKVVKLGLLLADNLRRAGAKIDAHEKTLRSLTYVQPEQTLSCVGCHEGVQLDAGSLNRLVTWMDVYAQKLGSFSPDQERRLYALRRKLSPIMTE